MEEFPEIIQGRRKHHLIVWAGWNLEHWDSDDVTDDLGINSDDVACHGGLKHHSTINTLHHFQVGVEELHQSGVHHTCTINYGDIPNCNVWIMSRMLSSGGTMISDRMTFRSAMTVRSIILAWIAALSSIILWRTLRDGLPADMILHRKPTRFATKIQNNILVRLWKILDRITAVKRTFAKI